MVRSMLSVHSPEVNDNLLVFSTVQREMLSLHTPGQAAHLAPVICLISVADETHHSRVIRKFNEAVGVVWRCAVVGQQSEEEGASARILGGGPCVSGDGAGCVTADPYCLRSPGQKVQQPVAQRRIEPQLYQFMDELLRDDCVECWTEVYEQQSDIRSVLSRCVRAGWRAVAMASSVERLDLYANWKGSREGGRTDLMCCMTNRSKHFMRIGVSATGR